MLERETFFVSFWFFSFEVAWYCDDIYLPCRLFGPIRSTGSNEFWASRACPFGHSPKMMSADRWHRRASASLGAALIQEFVKLLHWWCGKCKMFWSLEQTSAMQPLECRGIELPLASQLVFMDPKPVQKSHRIILWLFSTSLGSMKTSWLARGSSMPLHSKGYTALSWPKILLFTKIKRERAEILKVKSPNLRTAKQFNKYIIYFTEFFTFLNLNILMISRNFPKKLLKFCIGNRN